MTLETERKTVPVADMIPIIKEALLEKQVEMTVTGNSMMPLLIDRKSVVRLTAPLQLKKGDIVLFERTSGSFMLHRITAVSDGFYDIIGDNQYVPDRHVPKEAIIAKVSEYNRKGRKWKMTGKTYLLVLPILKGTRRFLSRVKGKLQRVSILKSQK